MANVAWYAINPVSVALFEIGQSRPEDVLFARRQLRTLPRGWRRRSSLASTPTAAWRSTRPNRRRRPKEPIALSLASAHSRASRGAARTRKPQSPEAVLSVTHVGEGRCPRSALSWRIQRALLNKVSTSRNGRIGAFPGPSGCWGIVEIESDY